MRSKRRIRKSRKNERGKEEKAREERMNRFSLFSQQSDVIYPRKKIFIKNSVFDKTKNLKEIIKSEAREHFRQAKNIRE